MTKNDLTELLIGDFYGDFAEEMAAVVIGNRMVGELYQLAIDSCALPKAKKEKLLFRSAYVLETIFFNHRELFEPFRDRFFDDFVNCTNNSAKRHFTKIMAHLLQEMIPANSEAIAEKCAEWAVDKKLRVAPKIWAVEVLFLLKNRVSWVGEILPEIVEVLETTPSPALECRIKRWRNVRIV